MVLHRTIFSTRPYSGVSGVNRIPRLFLIDHYKDHTINTILAKDDGELALDVLMGNVDFPFMDGLSFENKNQTPQSKRSAGKNGNASLFADYKKNRVTLGEFHHSIFPEFVPPTHMYGSAKKLGIYNGFEILVGNEAEMNLHMEYCLLHHHIKGKNFIKIYLDKNKIQLQGREARVVNALFDSHFTILKIDKLYTHSAIQVHDLLKDQSALLFDQAMNSTLKVGHHIICTLLNMGSYVMTSGAAIPFVKECSGGGEVMDIFSRYLTEIKGKKQISKASTARCVTDIYAYCLQTGAMAGHTLSEVA